MNGIVEDVSSPDRGPKQDAGSMPYQVLMQYGLQPRPLRVIGVGAGASGLLLAYKIQRNFDDVSLTIFEKNPGVSGTWFENAYPGCACDNFSHTYVYSFEPKPDWSTTYASSKEIRQYFTDFCHKYGLEKYIKLSHQVMGAWWQETTTSWLVRVRNNQTGELSEHEADVLVTATGVLNAWKWPTVQGLDKFKGEKVHSAAWDETLNLKDKIVALVGNGSSAIQILPAILPDAKRVINFIRTPTWITTPWGEHAPRAFTQEEIQTYTDDSMAHLTLRKLWEATYNGFWKLFVKDSPEGAAAREVFTKRMSSILGDNDLITQMIPNWPLGCRRLTPGVGYLEALVHPKTTIVRNALAEVTESSVISSSGEGFPCDVIVCASGFDTTFKPRYPLVGRNSQDLRDLWANEPKGYLGLGVPEFPNLFTFLGPNCPIGNGPVLSAIEAQGDYICKFIYKMQTEGIRTVSPKMAASDEFMEHKEAFFGTTVWSESCNSWYKLPNSQKIAALWTGSTVHYLRAVENPRYEDWDYEYLHRNRWSYLGNGQGRDDADRLADLAWYIRSSDDAPIIGTKRSYSGPWKGMRGHLPVDIDS